MEFDIKWHDATEEMPGTDYDYNKNWYGKFIIRYSWEDDLSECFYKMGRLINGKFKIDFDLDEYSVESYEELESDYTISHWAMIDHPDDYD